MGIVLIVLGLLFMAGGAWEYFQTGSIDTGIGLFGIGLILLVFGIISKKSN